MDVDDIVIIRDESFPALLAEFLSLHKPGMNNVSSSNYDAVLSCGNDHNIPVHRLVLASVSDFLSEIFREFESHDDLKVVMDDMNFDVLKLVVDFAYTGEALIPATSADDVFEASQRLGIKFLKDSFVRLDHQDYEDIRSGKKALDFSAPGDVHSGNAPVLESSDTESAESPDNESAAVKEPGNAKDKL